MRNSAEHIRSKKQGGGKKSSRVPAREPAQRPSKDAEERSQQERDREEDDLDETVKQSFPASDPPAWTLGVNIPGERSPRRHGLEQ